MTSNGKHSGGGGGGGDDLDTEPARIQQMSALLDIVAFLLLNVLKSESDLSSSFFWLLNRQKSQYFPRLDSV